MAAEKNFENRVKKYLDEYGCWWLKYWGGAAYTKNKSKSALDETVSQANALDTSLGSKIVEGTQINKDITASGNKAVSDINSASAKVLEDINTTGTAKLDAVNKAAEAIAADREQIATNKEDIGSLKEELSNKITKFYASNQGKTHLADSDNGKIQDMLIYGKSSQDGTPSVENPVEIKSVVNPTIKLFGNNILKIADCEYQDGGVTTTVSNGVIKIKGTANRYLDIQITADGDYFFKEGTKIIFSSNNVKGIENKNGAYLDFTNNHTLGFSIRSNNINTPYIIKEKDTKYSFILFIRCHAGETYDETWKPQVLIGETITPFKPYTEQAITLPITLNAIPVSSGGNVTIDGQQYIADYVDVERGKVIRNILKWRLADLKSGFNNTVWHMNISGLGIDGSKIGLSNMFKIQNSRYNATTTSEFYVAYDGKSAALNMRGMTDEEFKKWLIEKNPEVYNVLTVAEEIPITLEEASAFKQLMTYYPVTNISVNSEQLDGHTVFNYPISMANGWNYVKKQLNDNRDYIYDMDLQSAEAYVNSEYAVALTELEV